MAFFVYVLSSHETQMRRYWRLWRQFDKIWKSYGVWIHLKVNHCLWDLGVILSAPFLFVWGDFTAHVVPTKLKQRGQQHIFTHSHTHTRTQDISDYMLFYGLFVKAFVKSISPQLLDLPLLWAHFSPFHSTHLSASPLSVGDSCISDRHFPFYILTWHLLSFPVSTSQSAPAVFLANPNRHWRKYWEKMICMTKAAVLLVCAPSGWGCCILSEVDQVLSSLLY